MRSVSLPIPTTKIPSFASDAIPSQLTDLLTNTPILAVSASIVVTRDGYGRWTLPIRILVERDKRVVVVRSMDEALALAVPGIGDAICALQFMMTANKVSAAALATLWQEYEDFEGEEGHIDAFFLPYGIALRSQNGFAVADGYLSAFLPYAQAKTDDPELWQTCLDDADDHQFCPPVGLLLFPKDKTAHAVLSSQKRRADALTTWTRLVFHEEDQSVPFPFTLEAQAPS